MKKLNSILLTILLIIMTTNVIVADETTSINIDSNGYIIYNIPIDIPFEDLIDLEKYITMAIINDDEESITFLSTLLNVNNFSNDCLNTEITITIKIFDVDTEEYIFDATAVPELGTYVAPTFYLEENTNNDYLFVIEGTSLIDTVEITGNEIGTKLQLHSPNFSQNTNVIKINKEAIKDFSIVCSTADISLIENGNVVKSFLDVKLNDDVLVNSIKDIEFNITHDSNNFYLSIDNSTYTNGISFIHVYAVEGLTKSIGYTIGEHKAYGDDPQAYDLTSTNSIISLIDSEDLDSLMSTTSPIAIPIPDFAKDHRKIAVDVYSDGYVTSHNLYVIPKPNPPKSVDKDEEIEVIETVQIYIAPNTSVR